MSQTMEEFESLESEGKISWILGKAVSVGKKVLTAGVVVSSAPLLLPPLIVASTIAFISSVPFCLFLANYACTQKVMRSLLPPNEETSGINKDESWLEDVKLGHMAEFYGAEPILSSEEDDEMEKESTSMIERIRDEGRTERGTSEKELQDGEKSGEAQDQTGHEGELEGTTTEGSTGKDEETSSNKPIEQAVSAPSGTGEEKRKNTTKKKKKTGRAGVQ